MITVEDEHGYYGCSSSIVLQSADSSNILRVRYGYLFFICTKKEVYISYSHRSVSYDRTFSVDLDI